MTGLELLAVALGMRHGVDPDHLAAVDGLSRVRPSPLNGVLFALGHGGVVTLLAFPAASPVSYTHLRAHETGRNLVCRLLLEKKKKKK